MPGNSSMTAEELARTLTRLVRRVNGTDPAVVEPERFGADTLLYEELDVDSLAMVELAEDIEAQFGIAVPDDGFKGLKTFGDMADYVSTLVR